jgi:hypothetical protein
VNANCFAIGLVLYSIKIVDNMLKACAVSFEKRVANSYVSSCDGGGTFPC